MLNQILLHKLVTRRGTFHIKFCVFKMLRSLRGVPVRRGFSAPPGSHTSRPSIHWSTPVGRSRFYTAKVAKSEPGCSGGASWTGSVLAAAGGSLITGLLISNLREQVPVTIAESHNSEKEKPNYVYASKEDLRKVSECGVVLRPTVHLQINFRPLRKSEKSSEKTASAQMMMI